MKFLVVAALAAALVSAAVPASNIDQPASLEPRMRYDLAAAKAEFAAANAARDAAVQRFKNALAALSSPPYDSAAYKKKTNEYMQSIADKSDAGYRLEHAQQILDWAQAQEACDKKSQGQPVSDTAAQPSQAAKRDIGMIEGPLSEVQRYTYRVEMTRDRLNFANEDLQEAVEALAKSDVDQDRLCTLQAEVDKAQADVEKYTKALAREEESLKKAKEEEASKAQGTGTTTNAPTRRSRKGYGQKYGITPVDLATQVRTAREKLNSAKAELEKATKALNGADASLDEYDWSICNLQSDVEDAQRLVDAETAKLKELEDLQKEVAAS